MMNFEPRPPILILIAFLLFYGAMLGTAVFFITTDLLNNDPTTAIALQMMFIVAAYFAGFILLLFYGVFAAYRFAFGTVGMQVLTWRGHRFFAWKQVQKSTVSNLKGNVSLSLHYGKWRWVTIPLHGYRKKASLLAEIKNCLPVATIDTIDGAGTKLTDN